MKVEQYRLVLAVAGACLLCSCAHVPSARRDALVIIPQSYEFITSAETSSDRWWTIFQDEQLDRIIIEALGNNLALQQVRYRLEQAHAIARKAGAEKIPLLSLEGSAARYRSLQMDPAGSKSVQTADQLGLKMAASYEVDLWGRIGATTRAAVLDAQVARDNLDTAAMTLVAQIVDTWFRIAAFQERLSLLQNQIKSNEDQVRLQELRFDKGHATAVDVLQQREQLAALRTLPPRLEAAMSTTGHQLAVLLGRQPQMTKDLTPAKLPELPPLPNAGVPADLLRNRPDVQAALKTLSAADERVAVAIANRLPALRLTASGSYAGAEASDIFDDWLWNIAGNILTPILDGGRRRAEVSRSHAVAGEQLARLGEVLLNAMREVEDALVNEEKQGKMITRQEEHHNAALQSLIQVRSRYQQGLMDYLFVLNALEREQSAARALTVMRQERLSYRVQLHRALGGQWMRTDLEQAASPEGEKQNE